MPNPFQKFHLLLENFASKFTYSFLLLQADSYNLTSYSVFRNLSNVSSFIIF